MLRFTSPVALSTLILSTAASLAEEPTEADYRRLGKYFVGTWTWETQGVSGTVTTTLSPTNQCLTFNASLNGTPVADGIEGYDAEKKSWKRLLFWARGGHAIAHTTIVQPAEGESLKGLTLKGTVRDVDADGRATESNVTYTIVDDDEWKVERQDGTIVYTRRKK